jgi:hypothetical protein
MIWTNILTGIGLIVLTILIHSIVTRFILFRLKKRGPIAHRRFGLEKELEVSVMILILFFAGIAEASVWACVYFLIGAIPTFETALYFSVVTLTTLGYGDVTLHSDWHLLASIEAAIGIILFGWSTAIVMAVVQKLYIDKRDFKQ